MPHYADKQAINEHSVLSACMDTAKHIIHKKENLAYKGKNIGIAILDTGISPVEDFLLPYNRIVAFRDFVGNKITPYDDNGHGTHMTCLKSKLIFKYIFTYSNVLQYHFHFDYKQFLYSLQNYLKFHGLDE